MGKVVFILGGTGSGKSTYAVNLAKNNYKKVAFIATCPYFDEETRERIKRRKQERPAEWQTFEEFTHLAQLLEKINAQYDFEVVIIDCLTLFVSNLLLEGHDEDYIRQKVIEMYNVLKNAKFKSIIISNEVGLSAISEDHARRNLKNISGRMNQIIAKKAESAYFIIAGLPINLKESTEPAPSLRIKS